MRLRPVNDVDPITLEPPTPPVFKHFNSAGKLNAFDARNLAEYFRVSGNFIHPVTREPFTRVDVMRLQNLLPPEERTLLQQMPQLAAQREASLNADSEVRVAETAVQLILENVSELAVSRDLVFGRKLRILYSVFLPDVTMLISTIAMSFGYEHARRILETSLQWLDAQHCANLVTLTDVLGNYDEQRASQMITIFETTRREIIRIAADLAALELFVTEARAQPVGLIELNAIIF